LFLKYAIHLFNIRRADHSTVPKIVIKPRTPAVVASSSRLSLPSNPATPTTEIEEDDDQQDIDEGQAMDVDQDHASQTEDNPQTGDEDIPGVTPGRPRGRPRGRGRGALSGTSTPRARGRRGRGRGRGRGVSSLLIRLPKRGDDDADVDGDADVEGDADADDGTLLDGDVVELVEKEAPMGGGKPFRKIQGQVYIIDGDEFVTEDNPVGDEKIDQFGNLLGGTQSFLFPLNIVFLKKS
jgi:chromatin structure-remodeling complex protein RSC7